MARDPDSGRGNPTDDDLAEAAWYEAYGDAMLALRRDGDGDARGTSSVQPLISPGEPRLPLEAWLRLEADRYRRSYSELGRWLATKIDELADAARLTGASTPAQLDDRVAALERDRADELMARGYDAALACGCPRCGATASD
jgi:hypothetical protein